MKEKIGKAIDKVEQDEARPTPQVAPAGVAVRIRIAEQIVPIGPGNFLKLVPKVSKEPTLLVWVPEQGVYQPVAIAPGGTWMVVEEERVAPPTPPLWIPR